MTKKSKKRFLPLFIVLAVAAALIPVCISAFAPWVTDVTLEELLSELRFADAISGKRQIQPCI